ncbi:MAG: hypothetical protein K2O61_00205 [Bacteroidaceae bacterium]|nr:hypothetical protein [Bacteroidaceae bacterium]
MTASWLTEGIISSPIRGMAQICRNGYKIDVPDSDWSESGTSVSRSRGLRFRGAVTDG